MLVLPIVIPGTGETVKNLPYLLSINVTHVLNTAECDVNVNPKRYTKEGICYKGFRVNDVPHADISQVSWPKVYFALNSLDLASVNNGRCWWCLTYRIGSRWRYVCFYGAPIFVSLVCWNYKTLQSLVETQLNVSEIMKFGMHSTREHTP